MAYVTPPNFTAGNPLTAAQMTIIANDILALVDRVQMVRKPSDQSLTSVAALTNDTDLKFTAVAGQSYVFNVSLIVSTSTAAIDIACGFSFPSGTLAFGIVGQDTAATTNISSAMINGTASATSGTTSFTAGAISGVTNVNITGTFLCTVGGTVNFQWAQGVSTATALAVKAGSSLQAFRVTV